MFGREDPTYPDGNHYRGWGGRGNYSRPHGGYSGGGGRNGQSWQNRGRFGGRSSHSSYGRFDGRGSPTSHRQGFVSLDPSDRGDATGAWNLGHTLSELGTRVASSRIVPCVVGQVPPSDLQRVVIFDFDKTLLFTPDQSEGCAAYELAMKQPWEHRGYYGNRASLLPPCLADPAARIINPCVTSLREAIADPNAAVVVLTSRREFGGVGTCVRDILSQIGFANVPVVCNPFLCDGSEFKIDFTVALVDAVAKAINAAATKAAAPPTDDFPALGAPRRTKAAAPPRPPPVASAQRSLTVEFYDDNCTHAVAFDGPLRTRLRQLGHTFRQYLVEGHTTTSVDGRGDCYTALVREVVPGSMATYSARAADQQDLETAAALEAAEE